jgi:hypothetical protein
VQNFRHWFFCSPSKYSSLLHNGDTTGAVTGLLVGFETGVSVGEAAGAVLRVGSSATRNVMDSVVLALPLALVCSYAIAATCGVFGACLKNQSRFMYVDNPNVGYT